VAFAMGLIGLYMPDNIDFIPDEHIFAIESNEVAVPIP
jgi:hypothetical protein